MDDAAMMKLLRQLDPCGASGLPIFFPKRAKDLVTMIVTTSIIPIHPETRLMQEVMSSHVRYEPALEECSKIIVCDHPKISVSGVREYKSGKVLSEDMLRYEEYISRLEGFATSGESPFQATKILRCTRYRGFAMAVHEALKLVETPYVMIIQHDRVLARPFDVVQVLDLMQANASQVKYIGLASNKSEGQVHMMSSRYQLDVTDKLFVLENDPDEPLPELMKRLVSNHPSRRKPRRMLVPLIFWYDSTHIACTEHYRKFVFGEHVLENVSSYARTFKLGTGDFIEDKLGQAEREDIKANGLAVHKKYGNYLLEDGAGPFVQHCHGRMIGTSSARTFEVYFGDS